MPKNDAKKKEHDETKTDAIFKTAREAGAGMTREELRAFFAEEKLDETIEKRKEFYGLSWAGKSRAKQAVAYPTDNTLRADRANGKNWDDTKNVFIEGDNLEALKLLAKRYFERVKMIYIDPPYNTGKDFIYKDTFAEGKSDYLERTAQTDDSGALLATNPETNGRYHSDWLSMMLSRLTLARRLLRDDGVIFVSIDDHEVANLRLLMDEIFGEENFVAQIVWQKKRGKDNSAKNISTSHEYIFLYAKSIKNVSLNKLEMSEKRKAVYANSDNDPRGVYVLQPAWASGMKKGPRYAIDLDGYFFKERMWLYSKETMLNFSKERKLSIKGSHKDGMPNVYVKVYLNEITGVLPDTIWLNSGNTGDAVGEIKNIFNGEIFFDTPKPTQLIRKMLQIATSKSGTDFVLDFFAGSGTTAHAVMAQNAEDGGNRRFILVQIPEATPEASEARKAGFETIADIARERILRAGASLQRGMTTPSPLRGATPPQRGVSDPIPLRRRGAESARRGGVPTEDVESPQQDGLSENFSKIAFSLDTGFRSFSVAPTNYRRWEKTDFNADEEAFFAQEELFVEKPLVDGFREEDVLWEVLVKEGFSLSCRLEGPAPLSSFSRRDALPCVSTQKDEKDILCYRATETLDDGQTERTAIVTFADRVAFRPVLDLNLGSGDVFVCFDNALADADKNNLVRRIPIKTL